MHIRFLLKTGSETRVYSCTPFESILFRHSSGTASAFFAHLQNFDNSLNQKLPRWKNCCKNRKNGTLQTQLGSYCVQKAKKGFVTHAGIRGSDETKKTYITIRQRNLEKIPIHGCSESCRKQRPCFWFFCALTW